MMTWTEPYFTPYFVVLLVVDMLLFYSMVIDVGLILFVHLYFLDKSNNDDSSVLKLFYI
jgi:hypothetical protein